MLFRGIPLLVGMAVSCVLLSYRIFREWRTRAQPVRGNLGELFVTVTLISLAIAVPTGFIRAARGPLYSKDAILLPLDQWKGNLACHLMVYDVWIEYPKAKLSEEQKAWFSEPHSGENFFRRFGVDLRPRVKVKRKRERPLSHKVTFVSDTGEWVGEFLDVVLAGDPGDSVLYLDNEAAHKLGQLGARLVVDVPTNERGIRGQQIVRSL
jgi:hypothetical protein